MRSPVFVLLMSLQSLSGFTLFSTYVGSSPTADYDCLRMTTSASSQRISSADFNGNGYAQFLNPVQ